MMTTYKEITNETGLIGIEKTEDDGKIWIIPIDESNSDYQSYLNKDKPQVEHLTEKPTPEQSGTL